MNDTNLPTGFHLLDIRFNRENLRTMMSTILNYTKRKREDTNKRHTNFPPEGNNKINIFLKNLALIKIHFFTRITSHQYFYIIYELQIIYGENIQKN